MIWLPLLLNILNWMLCIIAAGGLLVLFLAWVLAKTEGPYGGPFEDEHREPEAVPESPPYPSLYV